LISTFVNVTDSVDCSLRWPTIPFAVGIGLDEDTAAFIRPDETIEVEGSGGVTIVDGVDVSYSSMGEISEGLRGLLGLILGHAGNRQDADLVALAKVAPAWRCRSRDDCRAA